MRMVTERAGAIQGAAARVALALSLILAPAAFPGLGPSDGAARAEMAVTTAAIQTLAEAMQLPAVIGVMQAEGLDYGGALRDEMFAGKGGAEWPAALARIYDADRMMAVILRRLETELQGQPATVAAAQAFFGSATGQKIVALEVEARRALLDKATETAAQEAAADMEARGAPRMEALRRFAKANDLIELNVMGAMNANLAFYRGMSDGGGFGAALSEQDMLAEIWGQEAQVRADAEDWLWPYLALAYQPLSDEELQAYQRFSETSEGKRMNAALFAAFDEAFVQISRDLGRAAARMVRGEDI